MSFLFPELQFLNSSCLLENMGWKQLVFTRKYGLEIVCVFWKIWVGNNLCLLENMDWKQLVFAGKYGLETACVCWKIWARNRICVACHC